MSSNFEHFILVAQFMIAQRMPHSLARRLHNRSVTPGLGYWLYAG